VSSDKIRCCRAKHFKDSEDEGSFVAASSEKEDLTEKNLRLQKNLDEGKS
jgi:hypothetical protein